MTGVTAIVTRADPEALRAALTIAAAAAALGGRARVHCHERAVALLATAADAPDDDGYRAHGMPALAALIADAPALGIALVACQAGLALEGLDAARLPAGCAVGGLVGLLADLDGDRLIAL